MGDNCVEITVKGADICFACGKDECILQAMKRTGRGPIRCGCFGGGCGVCKMKVLSGAVRIIKPMSREHVTREEERQGVALLCCIQPLGDVVLGVSE